MKRLLIILFCLLGMQIQLGATVIELKDLRYFAYKDYTRFVLDLSAPLKIVAKKLPGKDQFRLYFDLKNCRLGNHYPREKRKEIRFKAGHLKRIRIGKRPRNTLRVVFDFTEVEKYNLFYLKAPYRIVLDFFTETESRLSVKTGSAAIAAEKQIEITSLPDKVNGKYSVARQLGLGVRTVIIDPGHGGKDPGTLNQRYRLYEKQIALDIAQRVERLFKAHRGVSVQLTRNSDKYLTLEERTAIANSRKGDLFVSIHVNSAPRKQVRGIETYYLSMTTDPHAIRVAAQENAISKNSLSELNSIVDKIIKNTKKEESSMFADLVQKAVIAKTRTRYKGVKNLGVKKAPFYVLVGAEMPSILIETSFISNRVEAERLRRNSYRQTLAEGIYTGIVKYIKTLGKK